MALDPLVDLKTNTTLLLAETMLTNLILVIALSVSIDIDAARSALQQLSNNRN